MRVLVPETLWKRVAPVTPVGTLYKRSKKGLNTLLEKITTIACLLPPFGCLWNNTMVNKMKPTTIPAQ